MNLLEDKNNPLWESKNVIYCYTNKINGKKYVGQTTNSLRVRNRQHIRESTNEGHGFKYHFHHDIRKYGIENFSLEILHIADKYSLDLLEIYYIEKWNLLDRKYGYNTSSGGSNGNTYAGKTDEEMNVIRKKMSESQGWQKGENHPLYGTHRSYETKNKIAKTRKNNGVAKGSKNPKSKRVAQYNLNEELIKIWNCMKDVEDELGISYQSISKCCRGVNKTAGCFKWKYIKED